MEKSNEGLSQLFEGQKFLMLGVANQNSLAWAAAEKARSMGAQVHVTYLHTQMLPGFQEAADQQGISYSRCDVTSPSDVDRLFKLVAEWSDGCLDGLLHSVAFANHRVLGHRQKTPELVDYTTAFGVSVASLPILARRFAPMMTAGGPGIITISYIWERVIPGYGFMAILKAALETAVRELTVELGGNGIRVNTVRAPAIMTMSSSILPGIDDMIRLQELMTPLRLDDPITTGSVADVIMGVFSPPFSSVTGGTINADGGFSLLQIPPRQLLDLQRLPYGELREAENEEL